MTARALVLELRKAGCRPRVVAGDLTVHGPWPADALVLAAYRLRYELTPELLAEAWRLAAEHKGLGAWAQPRGRA